MTNKGKNGVKPSDEVCDGDSAEDKELEDEDDSRDHIVDDNGFTNQWRGAKVPPKSLAQRRSKSLAQIKSKAKLHEKPSNEICDGDSADDKELEDENDPNDDIVDDNGFVKQW